jgi:hypothetical protein
MPTLFINKYVTDFLKVDVKLCSLYSSIPGSVIWKTTLNFPSLRFPTQGMMLYTLIPQIVFFWVMILYTHSVVGGYHHFRWTCWLLQDQGEVVTRLCMHSDKECGYFATVVNCWYPQISLLCILWSVFTTCLLPTCSSCFCGDWNRWTDVTISLWELICRCTEGKHFIVIIAQFLRWDLKGLNLAGVM